MEGLFSSLTLADTHQDIYRNIVSLRVTKHLFDDLSNDPDAWESAQQLEIHTKPPIYTAHQPIINRPFEEAEWNQAIGYPFSNSTQSRYSDGSYGVWYGANTLEATVCETVHHWLNKLLADAQGFDKPGVKIERKVYLVRCNAGLIDLRPHVQHCHELIHPSDYTSTHVVGARFHREGQPGLVTKSARCEDDIYAVFNAKVLSEPRHSCHLTYIRTASGVEILKGEEIWMVLR